MAWSRQRITVIGASALVIVALGGIAISNKEFREWTGLEREPGAGLPLQPREKAEMIAGDNSAEAGAEAFEAATIADQFAEARLAPGIVAPGAYGAAYSQLTGRARNEGHLAQRDPSCPTTRTIRATGTSTPTPPAVRAWSPAASPGSPSTATTSTPPARTAACGGPRTGGGHWTPIADKLPSLSSGWLVLAGDGSLWYATGEANTGGTSYVGSGVYRLANPRTGAVLAGRPGRRDGAGEHHHPQAALRRRPGLGADHARSVLARRWGPTTGCLAPGVRAQPELPARRARCRRPPTRRTRTSSTTSRSIPSNPRHRRGQRWRSR